MSANTCELVVGKLIEIRVGRGYRSVSDVEEMIEQLQRVVTAAPAVERFVIAADWRAVQVMPPDVAARARDMLAAVNTRVTRSAILAEAANPIRSLQLLRLIREAENPERRQFADADDLADWLAPVLTAGELGRLKVFLRGR